MKNKLRIILIIFTLFLASIYLSAPARALVISASSSTIGVFVGAYQSSAAFWRQYFATTQEIAALREENAQLAKYEVLYQALKSDYAELLGAQNPANIKEISSDLVRISGYERLGQRTRFWASAKEYSHPVGLAAKGYAVGILTRKENRSYAISIEDSTCAIAATVADQQAIVQGDGKRVWLDFVKDYAELKEGAKVYTSGMDGIFPAGVYIGQIERIEQKSGYKRALLAGNFTLLPYRYVQALSVADAANTR